MKKLLTIIAVVAFTVSITSCKKCIECKADANSTWATDVKQEYCGNKKQRDQFEANWMFVYSGSDYKDVKCD